jgi:heat shock protein HslJ
MKLFRIIMAVIIVLGGILTMTACQDIASPLEDYTWVMTSYSEAGKTINALPGVGVTAFFSSKDETVSGNAGCNSYGGRYKLDRLALSFPGPLTSTLMACSEAINQQESEYLKILQKADSFEMDHGNLIIHCDRSTIKFTRKTP